MIFRWEWLNFIRHTLDTMRWPLLYGNMSRSYGNTANLRDCDDIQIRCELHASTRTMMTPYSTLNSIRHLLNTVRDAIASLYICVYHRDTAAHRVEMRERLGGGLAKARTGDP